MKKTIMLSALGLILLAGCSSDDSNGSEQQWHLIDAHGSLFERGTMIWRFNMDKKEILVEDNRIIIPAVAIESFPGEGLYDFSLEITEACDKSFTMANFFENSCITTEKNEMHITRNDGRTFHFVK